MNLRELVVGRRWIFGRGSCPLVGFHKRGVDSLELSTIILACSEWFSFFLDSVSIL
jgi:hypothetical protein